MWEKLESGSHKNLQQEADRRILRNALIYGAALLLNEIENEDPRHVLLELEKQLKGMAHAKL